MEEQEKVAGEQETVIESLVENVEKYTATTIELAKLKSVLKTSDALSNIAVSVILMVMAFMTIIFLSIGGAIWVGELLGSLYSGFLVVAGFYALIGLLAYLMRIRVIKNPISNALINHFID
jgi:ABC-type bacteriocin/lantibiotic exporter with double-glycine peptidase domain